MHTMVLDYVWPSIMLADGWAHGYLAACILHVCAGGRLGIHQQAGVGIPILAFVEESIRVGFVILWYCKRLVA